MLQAAFLDTDTIDRGDLDLSGVTGLPGINWRLHGTTEPQQLDERIEGCAIVVSNKVVLDGDTLARHPALKLIVIAATGTNNVDLQAARERGIVVCNVRGYGTPSVVQHVYALILALTTRLLEYHAAIEQGRWQRHPHFCLFDYPIRELDGKNLGIIGYGTLGRGVAAAAPAFGLNVLISQRPGGPEKSGRLRLPELLAQADILSLHCPLNEHTHNLIGAEQLALMKPDAVLINTARGGIVDEDALAAALREGRLGGAGVDVLTEEPPRNGNVLLEADIPNLIVTPHIAWASRESRQRVIDIVADNIAAYRNGQPQNLVD
jgi:glycerate dehydrogenase